MLDKKNLREGLLEPVEMHTWVVAGILQTFKGNAKSRQDWEQVNCMPKQVPWIPGNGQLLNGSKSVYLFQGPLSYMSLIVWIQSILHTSGIFKSIEQI